LKSAKVKPMMWTNFVALPDSDQQLAIRI